MKQPNKCLKIWSALLLTLVLTTGCSLFKTKEVEVPYYIQKSIEKKERPEGLSLVVPKFYAVSETENLNKFLEANKFRNGSIVFIALDVSDYELLALNTAEFERYIKQLLAVVAYYEKRITPKDIITKADEQKEIKGTTNN